MLDGSNKLSRLQQEARDSAERVNEVSTEYTNNLNVINGRVVVIAVGSASLLFTFIGVLFGSNRATSALEYRYVILAIVGFLLSSGLLLASGWFASLFRFNMVSRYNLEDRIHVRDEEIRISEAGRILKPDGTLTSAEEIKKHTGLLKDGLEKMRIAIKKIEAAEKRSHILYRTSLIGGYAVLVSAYIFTLLFFIGVIDIINR